MRLVTESRRMVAMGSITKPLPARMFSLATLIMSLIRLSWLTSLAPGS